MAAVLALLSSVVWGTGDFIGGLASRRSTALQTLMIATPAGLIALLLVTLVVHGQIAGSVVPGVAAGCLGSLGIMFLYAGLSIGPMGVVSPISAVLGAAIPVVVGLARGERPGVPAYVGMALAAVAIVTVGLEPRAPTDDSRHQRLSKRALAYAVLAGIGIGGFFSVVSLAPKDTGIWPVVWARAAATVMFLVFGVVMLARTRQKFVPDGRSVRLQAGLAGVFDASANGIYLVASHTGLLSLVAVLGSLYPATTVVLARFVLAERLRPMQKVGMVTALVAAVLLTIG